MGLDFLDQRNQRAMIEDQPSSIAHAESQDIQPDTHLSLFDSVSIEPKTRNYIELLDSKAGVKVLAHLGSGASGDAFLVTTGNGESLVAKCLDDPPIAALYCPSNEVSNCFPEIALTHRIHQPEVPKVLHAQRLEPDDGPPVIVLFREYCPGDSLETLINRGGTLSIAQVVEIVEKVADLLERMNSGGDVRVVHGDIKPTNLIIDGDKLALSDFDIARKFKPGHTHLHTIAIKGTPHYMAREQLVGDLRPASDVYSLGVTAIRCLFGAELPDGLKDNYDKSNPYTLPSRLPDGRELPVGLRVLLGKMVHPDLKKRYASATELLTDLRDENLLTQEIGGLSTIRSTWRSVMDWCRGLIAKSENQEKSVSNSYDADGRVTPARALDSYRAYFSANTVNAHDDVSEELLTKASDRTEEVRQCQKLVERLQYYLSPVKYSDFDYAFFEGDTRGAGFYVARGDFNDAINLVQRVAESPVSPWIKNEVFKVACSTNTYQLLDISIEGKYTRLRVDGDSTRDIMLGAVLSSLQQPSAFGSQGISHDLVQVLSEQVQPHLMFTDSKLIGKLHPDAETHLRIRYDEWKDAHRTFWSRLIDAIELFP